MKEDAQPNERQFNRNAASIPVVRSGSTFNRGGFRGHWYPKHTTNRPHTGSHSNRSTLKNPYDSSKRSFSGDHHSKRNPRKTFGDPKHRDQTAYIESASSMQCQNDMKIKQSLPAELYNPPLRTECADVMMNNKPEKDIKEPEVSSSLTSSKLDDPFANYNLHDEIIIVEDLDTLDCSKIPSDDISPDYSNQSIRIQPPDAPHGFISGSFSISSATLSSKLSLASKSSSSHLFAGPSKQKNRTFIPPQDLESPTSLQREKASQYFGFNKSTNSIVSALHHPAILNNTSRDSDISKTVPPDLICQDLVSQLPVSQSDKVRRFLQCDATSFVSVSMRGSIDILDIESLRVMPQEEPTVLPRPWNNCKKGGVSAVTSMIHPMQFATGGYDHAVHLWDVKSDLSSASPRTLAIKHNSLVQSLLAIRDTSHKLISAGADCNVHVWDLSSERVVNTLRTSNAPYQLHAMTSPFCTLLEVAHRELQFEVRDHRRVPEKPVLRFGYNTHSVHGRYIKGATKSTLFACGSRNGFVRLWDLRNVESVASKVIPDIGDHTELEVLMQVPVCDM
ncbi:hypothetical protein H0H93_008327 [Arthromyces matolae]|nr:hypothetical protein H0H93_008327 [Arthromyces matolae]